MSELTAFLLLFPTICLAGSDNWKVNWDRHRPIPIHLRENWANQRTPDGPLRKWIVDNIPFLADGRWIGPVNGLTPLYGIPLGLSGVCRLYFLHWGQPGEKPPEYHICYQDGTILSIPIKSGPHYGYAKWYFDKEFKTGQPDACQVWTWDNPHPEKTIYWMDIHTARSVGIYLLAVTAETKDKFVVADSAAVEAAIAQHIKEVTKAENRVSHVLKWTPISDSERPRLLFSNEDLPRFKVRLAKGVPAYLLSRYKPWADDGAIDGYANFVTYLDSGDRKYLQQLKRDLFELTEALLSGLKRGESPQMPGRRMSVACFEYDFLAAQGGLDVEDAEQARHQLATAMYTMIDPNYWQSLEPEDGFLPDNMSSFLLNGVAAFALTFPNHPESMALIEYVRTWYDFMLNTSYGCDGGYMEAMGYAYGAYWPMLNVAYMFRHNKIRDLFADRRFQKATYALATLMAYPDYETANFKDPNCDIFLTKPERRMYSVPFGNANFGGAGSYWLYLAAEGFKKHNPQLASELMWIWDWCGQPMTPGLNPGMEFLADENIRRIKPDLKSEVFRTYGRALLRNPKSEVYCLFYCGPQRAHYHLDKGSFSLQAYGHTLSIDPGVAKWTNEKDYSRSLEEWFKHPRSHNTLTFTGEDPGPAKEGQLIHFQAGKRVDYVCGQLQFSENIPLWRRHIIFLHPNLYIIWDQLESKLAHQFNYHPIAKELVQDSNWVRIIGHHGVDTDFVVLTPEHRQDRIVLDEDQKIWRNQEIDLWGVAKWIRVKAQPGESFLVLIHPYKGSSCLKIKPTGESKWEFSLGQEEGLIVREGTGADAYLTVSFGGETIRCQGR